MRLMWPSRIIVIGGSCSGKTYLVRQMILRNDFNVNKKDLHIIVASPVQASLNQLIWRDLASRGFAITPVMLKKGVDLKDALSGQPIAPSGPLPLQRVKMRNLARYNAVRKRPLKLLIVDDVDHVTEIKQGREMLLDLFGTESHHSNITVILIAHHLKIGCPAIKASADAVIICTLPIAQLKQAMKDLNLTQEEEDKVMYALNDPTGAPPTCLPNQLQPLFNNAVVWRKPLFTIEIDEQGNRVALAGPSIFRLPRDITSKPDILPV